MLNSGQFFFDIIGVRRELLVVLLLLRGAHGAHGGM
jgi:hypothetical protein